MKIRGTKNLEEKSCKIPSLTSFTKKILSFTLIYNHFVNLEERNLKISVLGKKEAKREMLPCPDDHSLLWDADLRRVKFPLFFTTQYIANEMNWLRQTEWGNCVSVSQDRWADYWPVKESGISKAKDFLMELYIVDLHLPSRVFSQSMKFIQTLQPPSLTLTLGLNMPSLVNIIQQQLHYITCQKLLIQFCFHVYLSFPCQPQSNDSVRHIDFLNELNEKYLSEVLQTVEWFSGTLFFAEFYSQ